MSKQVQIDQDLFIDIVKLICLDVRDERLRQSVSERLRDKVDRMAARQKYREQRFGDSLHSE